jgi:hypothetical protein
MKKIFYLVTFVVAIAGCSKDSGDRWNEDVIPVSMVGIEAVNIDNSGEFPEISVLPIRKEAYMVGVKWITEHTVSDNDIFITDVIKEGAPSYHTLGNKYKKAIMCHTAFSASIPAGSYVSKFFKEIDRKYLPADVDEGFVLLVAPIPGEHSFRVEYYEGNNLKFFHDTPTINFY